MLRITSPRNGVEYAVFEFGQFPSRSEIATIKREGLGLRLASVPHEVAALDGLVKFADSLTHLDVSAIGPTDARAIESLIRLEELSYSGNLVCPVDLSRLENLTTYFGPHKNFETLAARTSLTELTLYPALPHLVEEIEGPLTTLSIVHTGNLRAVPVIRHPQHLETLSIDGPSSLDLEALPNYTSLRGLELSSIGSVTSLGVIRMMSALQSILLTKVRTVEEDADLLQIEDVSVVVQGRHGFSPEFVRDAQATGQWLFA
ncbi:hypothetical protein [Rhodoglobus sp.]